MILPADTQAFYLHARTLCCSFMIADYHIYSMRKDCPEPCPVELPALGKVVEMLLLNGLHHRYYWRAAQTTSNPAY